PQVLLLGSKNSTIIGRPLLPKSLVRLEVEELTKDRKVIAFKTRRRKSSRRTRGFRRDLTVLRVKEIVVGDEVQGDFVV
ncbi:50S ribosomal protein L21, partial [archaeon]